MGDQALQRDEVVEPPVAGVGDAETAARLVGGGLRRAQVAGKYARFPRARRRAASSSEPSGSSPSSASAAVA